MVERRKLNDTQNTYDSFLYCKLTYNLCTLDFCLCDCVCCHVRACVSDLYVSIPLLSPLS